MKNEMAKTRKVDNPYEIYRSKVLPGWEWRVLKKYQSPENEAKNELARWFTAVKSPMTYGDWEYGDTYVRDILVEAQAYKVNVVSDNFSENYSVVSDNFSENYSRFGNSNIPHGYNDEGDRI